VLRRGGIFRGVACSLGGESWDWEEGEIREERVTY